jgi:hypothetical protein
VVVLSISGINVVVFLDLTPLRLVFRTSFGSFLEVLSSLNLLLGLLKLGVSFLFEMESGQEPFISKKLLLRTK